LVFLFFILICLYEGSLIILYRFDRCGFIYKAGRKPVSKKN
jgi:hypothetical protein